MKRMMILIVLAMATNSFGQAALGEVVGEVFDKDKNMGAVDAHIYIDANGRRYQAKTDLDGRFRISAIPAGTYILNIRYQGDTLDPRIAEVPMDGFFNVGIIEYENIQMTDVVVVTAHNPNVIKLIDGNLPVATLEAEEIDKSPLKFDVKGLVTMMSSEVRQMDDGELVFRGARKGDMIYIVDGVKTRDVGSVPGVSIGRMMVYTGGLPAKYGDTLGGVVVMESKSYFDLYRKWEAAQLRKEYGL